MGDAVFDVLIAAYGDEEKQIDVDLMKWGREWMARPLLFPKPGGVQSGGASSKVGEHMPGHRV